MKFTRLLALLIITGLVSGFAKAEPISDSQAKKLNIIFIIVDDLGWKDFAYMGSKFYETPGIDKLASQSLAFSRAYEAAPRCVQSRTSIVTGRNHNRPELEGANGLALDQQTIGNAFQENGYRTYYVGKWHLGLTAEYWPQNRGFDLNKGGSSLGALASHFWPYTREDREVQTARREMHNVTPFGLEQGKKGEYIADRLTAETIAMLKAHKQDHSDKPFFLYLAHYQVHEPLEAKASDIKHFEHKLSLMPKDNGPDYESDYTGKVKLKQDLPVYAAMIKSVDESVVKIRQTLTELGYDNNTAIVLTSDNGGLSTFDLLGNRKVATSNKPLRTGKGWLYEGGMRVPLLVYWPGVTQAGTTTDRAVIGTDFYPTFLEMAGLPLKPKQHLDGESFLPVLKGNLTPRSKPLFWYFDDAKQGTGNTAMAAMLDGDMKLVRYVYENKDELYNIREDIGEHHNLAAKQPEKVASMKAALLAWQKELNIRQLSAKQISTIKGLIKEMRGVKPKATADTD